MYHILALFRGILLIVYFFHSAFGQDNYKCDDLIKARKGEINKYGSALDDYITDYSIYENALRDFEKIKHELINETNWATSNSVHVIKNIQAANNILKNLIGIASPAGDVMAFARSFDNAEKISQTAKSAYKVVKTVELGTTMAKSDDIPHTIFMETAKSAGRIGSAMALIDDLMNDVQDLNDYDNLKNEVKNQLNNIDKQISKHRNNINDLKKIKQDFANQKSYFDRFLKDHCGYTAEDNSVMSCVQKVEEIRGTYCGDPNSLTVKFKNNCLVKITINIQFERTNGSWSGWQSHIDPEKTGTPGYICKNSTGRYVYQVRSFYDSDKSFTHPNSKGWNTFVDQWNKELGSSN